MTRPLGDLRPVYVVGVGLHPYQAPSATTYVELGLTAVRAALDDAALRWPAVESAYVGTAFVGAAAGRPMLRHLGASGVAVTQVENASASGSSAFRLACLEVAGGTSDVVLAVGVDKPDMRPNAADRTGIVDLVDGIVSPMTHFALLADAYIRTHGLDASDIAAVGVKNFRNGALNPFAQRRQEQTLDDVLAGPALSGVLTKMQCCPIGEGAAAVVVASEDAIERLGIPLARATVRVAASVARSEGIYGVGTFPDAELTRETTAQALHEADVTASDLDVVEVHDAFTIEEIVYLEAIGLSKEGQAALDVAGGDFDIGGRCAVSASGGLLAMGHPVGPTGVGQIVEITRQLRGEAGARQQPDARVGLAHMLGVGTVCVEHVLRRV